MTAARLPVGGVVDDRVLARGGMGPTNGAAAFVAARGMGGGWGGGSRSGGGRGLHSSTFQLNVSAFCDRGCM